MPFLMSNSHRFMLKMNAPTPVLKKQCSLLLFGRWGSGQYFMQGKRTSAFNAISNYHSWEQSAYSVIHSSGMILSWAFRFCNLPQTNEMMPHYTYHTYLDVIQNAWLKLTYVLFHTDSGIKTGRQLRDYPRAFVYKGTETLSGTFTFTSPSKVTILLYPRTSSHVTTSSMGMTMSIILRLTSLTFQAITILQHCDV
jgi:hypothetical protein